MDMKADAMPMNSSFSQLNSCNEKTIIFMGETGVGKSTAINAFRNYMTFATMDAALEAARSGSLHYLIPTVFKLHHKRVCYEIHVGDRDDSDENTTDVGKKSATRYPKSYVFEGKAGRLRFI